MDPSLAGVAGALEPDPALEPDGFVVVAEGIAVDARPSDAIALALRTRAPILVEESVIDNAKTVDFGSERLDDDKVQKWLEDLDPAELPKYKM